jgi:hypothetical protein
MGWKRLDQFALPNSSDKVGTEELMYLKGSRIHQFLPSISMSQ